MNARQLKAIADYADDRSIANRNRLIVVFQYVVDGLIKKRFAGIPGEQREDLRQCGLIGLIQAADRYDPFSGVRFDTYAAHRISGAMFDACRREDVLSRQNRCRAKQWEQAASVLSHQLCRQPTHDEIEQELGIAPRAWDADMAAANASDKRYKLIVGNRTVGEDEIEIDLACDPIHEDAVDGADNLQTLLADGDLTPRERYAMRLRYEDGQYFRDIAAATGYSEVYVYMAIKSGLQKLRHRLELAA